MNKEFMRSFYRKYYAHSYDKAFSRSKRYRRLQKIRYQLDDELAAMMGGTNTSLYRKFDEYIGVYADEMNVMLEEAISSAQLAEKNYNNHVNPDKNCYRFSN